MPSAASIAAAAAVLASVARAADPVAISLEPGDWLGIDGNWSTARLLLGSNADLVNVMVSTALSEVWAVGRGGCAEKQPICSSARGGIYNPLGSSHWSSLGTYDLGLKNIGVQANGEYGLDTLNAYSPINDIGFGMADVLIAAINTTYPYQGMLGLSIGEARFRDHNNSFMSPLQQAVREFGWIPSYSYGFTAGAHYRGAPLSGTLGGYDAARFVSHENKFTLSPSQNIPRPLVRGIQVAAANAGDKPDQWTSTTEILSDWNGSFTALIDSSTPYLWLPGDVCDRFADAFNLTYNSTFGLYTLTNDQYRDFTSKDSLEFTFSLSSFDNNNDFGMPLQVPGVVNISLPLRAFVSLLQYPFAKEAIEYGAPAVPYFTLKRAPADAFAIGRAFLQEAYLITEFDRFTYSIHQALFPPPGVASLQLAKRPNDSPYPGPPTPARNGLTTSQMAGIAVGAVLLCLAVLAACFCFRRRRRRQRRGGAPEEVDDTKDTASTMTPDLPRSPASRILSRIARRGRSRRATPDARGAAHMPSEAPDCQIYELPAPVPPAELDGGNNDNSTLDETEFGTDNTHDLSAYELARRKLDRQLQGPVPAYSPPADNAFLSPEKAALDPRQPQTSRPMDQPSPVSPMRSQGGDSNSNTLAASEPSPISPRTDGNSAELPSPVTASVPSLSAGSGSHRGPTGGETRRSRLAIPTPSPPPPGATLSMPPRAAFQRTPIDPTRVVCLGPLPGNVQFPRQGLTGTDGRSVPLPRIHAPSVRSEGSLGSNYTEEEDMLVQELSRQAGVSPARSHHASPGIPLSRPGNDHGALCSGAEQTPQRGGGSPVPDPVSDPGTGHGRIDPGLDLIHVPQMAERRYSWEND